MSLSIAKLILENRLSKDELLEKITQICFENLNLRDFCVLLDQGYTDIINDFLEQRGYIISKIPPTSSPTKKKLSPPMKKKAFSSTKVNRILKKKAKVSNQESDETCFWLNYLLQLSKTPGEKSYSVTIKPTLIPNSSTIFRKQNTSFVVTGKNNYEVFLNFFRKTAVLVRQSFINLINSQLKTLGPFSTRSEEERITVLNEKIDAMMKQYSS